MNDIQKAILKIYRFCQKKDECEYKKCPLYKDQDGCIIGIPDNWDIQDLLIIEFNENEDI